MADGENSFFVRQRRNLILTSLFVIFYKAGNFQLEKINILGNQITVGNPEIITISLKIFGVYFLWRYFTACNEAKGINSLTQSCLMWSENIYNKYMTYIARKEGGTYGLLERGSYHLKYRLSDKDGNDRYIIIKWGFIIVPFLVFIPVSLLTSKFSEYILPYVLAVFAALELHGISVISLFLNN